jgi:ferredoxin--NADP+ reductase
MVWNPESEEPMWGTFVVGWARKASDGLVGKAKQDGEQGCDEVLAYLDGEFPVEPSGAGKSTDAMVGELTDALEDRETRYVTLAEVKALESVEQREAERRDLEEFKFSTNEEMLEAIDAELGDDRARATAE